MHERTRSRRRVQVLGLGAAAAAAAAVVTGLAIIIMLMAGSCRGEETETRRVRHNRSISENLMELDFIRNLAEVTSWRCEPKPRLVYLTEASENVPVMPPNIAWLIQATVLHRCERTMGCCPSQKECRPATMEKIRVTFKSVNLSTQVPSYHRIQFDNHTSCACI